MNLSLGEFCLKFRTVEINQSTVKIMFVIVMQVITNYKFTVIPHCY